MPGIGHLGNTTSLFSSRGLWIPDAQLINIGSVNEWIFQKERGRKKQRKEGRKEKEGKKEEARRKEGNTERDERKEGGKTPQSEAEERFRKVPTFLQHVGTLNYELMYLLKHFTPIHLSFS